MTDDASSAAAELPVMLGPGAGASETLMLIGAPDAGGVVHVRTWTADDWSAPARTRAERAATLLGWIEAQSRAGRTINQSLYALRLWLRADGSATR